MMPQFLHPDRAPKKQRQPKLPLLNDGRWGADYFLMPTRANLLRNFSTRPPRASTLFCVPV